MFFCRQQLWSHPDCEEKGENERNRKSAQRDKKKDKEEWKEHM